MDRPIITVEDLSKQYHIGTKEHINRTLREAITDAFIAPVRNFRNLRRLTRIENDQLDTIWALKDISLRSTRVRSSVSSAVTGQERAPCLRSFPA